MQINLPPEIQSYVDQQVAAGNFSNIDEMISALISDFRENSEFSPDEIASIKASVEKGISQLNSGDYVDGPSLMEELKEYIAGKKSD